MRYVFEAHDVWERVGLGPEESDRLTAAHANRTAARELREWFGRQARGTRLVVEKNPRHSLRVPFVRAVFPEAKLVHIVRDGRDAACSLLPGLGGRAWSHLRPPGWRRLLKEKHPLVRCARAWTEVLEVTLGDLADVPHLTVRYEALVADPRSVAAEIRRYLDLPPSAEMDAFSGRIQNETRNSYQAAGQTRWYRANHSVRVGRWREHAARDPKAFAEVEAITRPVRRRLGYVEA